MKVDRIVMMCPSLAITHQLITNFVFTVSPLMSPTPGNPGHPAFHLEIYVICVKNYFCSRRGAAPRGGA